MKIFLISANIAKTPYPVYPLGLSMIAGALVKNGHEVFQFDFLASGMDLEKLAQELERNNPQLVGISIRNIDNVNLLNEQRYIDVVKEIVKTVKTKTKVKIVLGGCGFSIMPQEILKEVGADYGVVGEGENIMVDFVNNAQKENFPKNVIMKAPLLLEKEEIASALYDPGIIEFYLKSGNVASVQTKRGCLHNCVYCTYPVLEGNKLRCRNPKDIVADIKKLVDQHQAKYIFFTDSVFNDNDNHYLEVLKVMKKNNINVPWTAFFKPEGLTDEAVSLMKETGLKAAEMGADAASDTALRGLGKSFLFQDVIASNDLFVKYGIATAHYYMFGCPGEDEASVLEGINNIKNMQKTVSFVFMGIRILPGTILADIALKEGVIKKDQNLLEPIYYIYPKVKKDWLEKTLTQGFDGLRNVVFPPDKLESSLQFLHKLGYSGSLWDMLIPGNVKRNRKRANEPK